MSGTPPNRKVTQLNRKKMNDKEQERFAIREQRRKRGLRRRLTVIGIVASLVVIFAGVGLISQYGMIQANKAEKDELQAQMEELEANEDHLEREIMNYQDEEYITEVARKDYYMSKPGETLFQLPEQEDEDE
ncbi:septum formation initiator family protein [Salicibibacter halophilus]|uniref:Septum formation initiator family protein n=1 Tax=Salicibibacter halophilus TaxID=2502791 RepID=A0A514LI87_9BACI|nr:septum formation initiator family protein [Salicibibacter halophilus]QDI91549.1 septum formation initiator family protein [Salicibibacter halophilus]